MLCVVLCLSFVVRCVLCSLLFVVDDCACLLLKKTKKWHVLRFFCLLFVVCCALFGFSCFLPVVWCCV